MAAADPQPPQKPTLTSQNLKNPGIFTPPVSAEGLDVIIEAIRARLATLVWLPKAFGLAWTKPRDLGGKIVLEPLLYQTRGEYYPALPNDSLKAYSFFRKAGARKTGDSTFWFNDPIDLIVWVDLKAINPAVDWIYTENLLSDVLEILDEFEEVNVTTVFDDKVSDIFAGYDLREIKQGLLLYPYAGFRISMTLTYEFACVE